MRTITDILLSVRRLRFHSRQKGEIEWSGEGNGVVSVDTVADRIDFIEKGSWQALDGRHYNFTNAYRWVVESQSLRLAHLRQGKDQPVHLVEMHPHGDRCWKSQDPHLCGQDTYRAELQLGDTHIVLHWFIEGPIKQDELRYEYYW